MKYSKSVTLKNDKECLLRSVNENDAQEVINNMVITHGETDFLLTYPEERKFDLEKEREFLRKKEESNNEVQICAFVDEKIVGTAGIDSCGNREKIRYRATFGITILKEYWHLGIGKAMINACIECAKKAGYKQLELEVVAENINAIGLYKSVGFLEYGRNPRGFYTRKNTWQELVLMRLELD